MADLLTELIAVTHAVPDRRRKEYHIACPFCGKESSPKDTHFSFSARGYKCFVCGASGSLVKMAKQLKVDGGDFDPPPKPKKVPYKPPSWFATPEKWMRQYLAHPERFDLWKAYKPLPTTLIQDNRLGVGKFPPRSSRCSHDRLIVPVFDGTILVGIRGRAIRCHCGKWLQAAGTPLEWLPLFNQTAVVPGSTVFIVENPIDALMVNLDTPFVGVATYSTSYWRPEWTQALVDANPEIIIVAFDNDLPGNGGHRNRETFIKEWRRSHPNTDYIPEARGITLANGLARSGLQVALFDWSAAEHKADIGGLISGATL